MNEQEATQAEIDFVFGAIEHRYEGFPTNYDGSVEVEVDQKDLLDLIWADHHNAERTGLKVESMYLYGEPNWAKVPDRLVGVYRISPDGTRTFGAWESTR